MKRYVATVLAGTALLVAGAPAAAGQHERIGQRINVLLGTPTTFPAEQPFHVVHGWVDAVSSTDYDAFGRYSFTLEVDGNPVELDFVERISDDGVLSRFWVFNFPGGLPAGPHTFTGRWWGPCQRLVDSGYDVGGPCTNPTELRVANGPLTRQVEFTRTNLALGKTVTASGEYPGNPASLAVDGNWWSYWSSGNFPPQWIEVDLGAVESVGEIDLGITQLPDCVTHHLLYGRAAVSDPYALLHDFSGYTVDQQVLSYVAPSPQEIRFVRVETSSSCSWVGWREVEVYGFEGS
jgi:F5/8 type C domain